MLAPPVEGFALPPVKGFALPPVKGFALPPVKGFALPPVKGFALPPVKVRLVVNHPTGSSKIQKIFRGRAQCPLKSLIISPLFPCSSLNLIKVPFCSCPPPKKKTEKSLKEALARGQGRRDVFETKGKYFSIR